MAIVGFTRSGELHHEMLFGSVRFTSNHVKQPLGVCKYLQAQRSLRNAFKVMINDECVIKCVRESQYFAGHNWTDNSLRVVVRISQNMVSILHISSKKYIAELRWMMSLDSNEASEYTRMFTITISYNAAILISFHVLRYFWINIVRKLTKLFLILDTWNRKTF